MKNKYNNKLAKFIAAGVVMLGLFSCEYQEIADADYPAQSIYLPVAANGIYALNDTTATGSPTFRYQLDIQNNKFVIPLSVYRSGTTNNGNVNVDVSVNNDTVNSLIAGGELIDADGKNIELMPADKYMLTPSVVINSGEEWKSFLLEIDLAYLSTQADKRLAVAVVVKSPQIASSPELGTAIIEINTKFIVPAPMFTYSISKTDDKTVVFENLSSYALTYQWNFGDGSASSEEAPEPHAYADYTGYPVSLTVTGITGIPVTYDATIQIRENVSPLYLENPGTPTPFVRSDSRTSRTGNLAGWITTDNLKSLSGGQLYGGFYNDATLGNMMDFYARGAIQNGKIYQTTTLPPDQYQITFEPAKFEGTNNCYFVVCKGNVMPDIEQIPGNENILIAYNWNSPVEAQAFDLEISSEQEITIGFVISTPAPTTGRINEIFIKSVGIYR